MPRTIWILSDQLAAGHTALKAADPGCDRVLMIEPRSWGAPLDHHRIKLVMIFSAMRHFAEELRAAGWTVDYHKLAETPDWEDAIDRHFRKFPSQEIWMMEPNSHPELVFAKKVAARKGVELRFFPSCQFLLPREDFLNAARGKNRLLMETHYRALRKRFEILVDESGEPEGGAWNFDQDNRRTVSEWKRDGAPKPPVWSREPVDRITREVQREVDRWFPDALGSGENFWPPVTRKAALKALEEFVRMRLPRFGAYQDLMLEDSPGMFHSGISAPINLGLLAPMECIQAAVWEYEAGRAPLAAVEGFVRQILGWREFIFGVYWAKMPEYASRNSLEARRALPEFFYHGKTNMNCLHRVLSEGFGSSYNHHIQRLMILGNFLLLAGIQPQASVRWFTEMYVDAWDWVMQPNVLGMALHADGGFMATKPYAASAAYISKMSNYCSGCAFDPSKKSGPGACPFNLLYWDFYDRNAERFAKNPRTSMMVNTWRKRPEKEKAEIRSEARRFLESAEMR